MHLLALNKALQGDILIGYICRRFATCLKHFPHTRAKTYLHHFKIKLRKGRQAALLGCQQLNLVTTKN